MKKKKNFNPFILKSIISMKEILSLKHNFFQTTCMFSTQLSVFRNITIIAFSFHLIHLKKIKNIPFSLSFFFHKENNFSFFYIFFAFCPQSSWRKKVFACIVLSVWFKTYGAFTLTRSTHHLRTKIRKSRKILSNPKSENMSKQTKP